MSIFITNLAFAGQPEVINAAKMAILVASASAGMLGLLWLATMTPKRLVP
jgi:NhaA family Na+:H+ antiporter